MDGKFQYDLHPFIFHRENLIQRLFEQFPVFEPVNGHFLATVVYPEVHDAGVALIFSHRFADLTASFRMFDPEIANAFVGVGESQISAFGMRK